MSERVLVTGGAGFIGSHLARSLLEDGFEVDVADNLHSGRRENVPDGATFHQLDLGQPDAIAQIPSKDYAAVLHLAGQSSGEKSFDDPAYDLDANARSTVLLADWALHNDVPAFVHASSMGVYGQPDSHPVAEDAPTRPLSWYGASKRAAELSLRAAAEHGLRTCSLRMFSVYGPGQDMTDLRQGMVSIYLAYLLRGEPVEVRGSLDRVRDLVHVDDVVAAWRAALDAEAGGPINIGSGAGTTVGELIERLISTCGLPTDHPVTEAEGTPGDQFALSADIARARDVLSWAPRTPLDDGLRAMVAWARGR